MSEPQFDPRVDAYIEKSAPFAQPILTHLRELMHRACPRATEAMKWSMPFFLQQGIILANMAAFKQHCAFGFWGPEMKKVLDQDGLNSSEAMGTLGRIASLKDLPSDKSLLAYMRHAADLVESGQRTKSLERPKKPAKKKPVSVPPALAAALKKNKVAAKAFAEFSPVAGASIANGSPKPNARKPCKNGFNKPSHSSRKASRATGNTIRAENIAFSPRGPRLMERPSPRRPQTKSCYSRFLSIRSTSRQPCRTEMICSGFVFGR